ncbi:MAG: hypothetical protein Q9169_004221 [Polycauliona sp. 2 TL-2023]
MLLEYYPATANHKDNQDKYSLSAIVSSEDAEDFCPIHYIYDYLPSRPSWLTAQTLSLDIFFSSHKQQDSRRKINEGTNSIALDIRSAKLPLHTGLTGPFLQNKYWKATEQSTKDFLQLFASDERCGRILLSPSNKKTMASLAEEQLEHGSIMDSYSRFTIYFWPEVDEHTMEETHEYFMTRLRTTIPCTSENTPLEQGIDAFRRDLLTCDNEEGGGNGGAEIIETLINFCHHREPPSFGSVREYLDYRWMDVGNRYTFAATTFAIRSRTTQHNPSLLPLLRHIGDHISIANDIASYAKERHAYESGKATAIINTVHVIMQQERLEDVDAAKSIAYAWQLFTEDAVRRDLEALREDERIGDEEWKFVEACLGIAKGNLLTSVVMRRYGGEGARVV